MPPTTNSISNQFADEFTGHTVNLLRFGEGVRGKIVGILKQLEEDLVGQINDINAGGTRRTDWRVSRLNALLKQTRDTISTAYSSTGEVLQSQLLKLSEVETKKTVKLMNDVIGAELAGVGIQKNVLKELTKKSLVNGAVQKDWWDKQDADTAMRFQTQMTLGVLGGESNGELVERLRGKPTGRKVVYEVDGEKKIFNETTGGIMQTSRREAEALVRTSVQTVANNVRMQTFKDNDDLVSGVQLLVTLDNRTTEICMSRSGGAWDLATGKPLEESAVDIPFPGPPPYHWGCRSTLIPIMKSWDQLIKEAGGDVSGIPEIDTGTQSSMDGQVAGDLNYEEWLETKDEDFQKDVLGEGKWKLWNDDKISFADLVDQKGRPLTLEELEEKAGVKVEEVDDDRTLEEIQDQIEKEKAKDVVEEVERDPEATFETAEITDSKLIDSDSVNDVYKVELSDGSLGAYKPDLGQLEFEDNPYVDPSHREVAAYQVDQFLGFDLVPKTVLKDGPQGLGSVQEFVVDKRYVIKSQIDPHILTGLNMFDFLIGNADRHGKNALMNTAGKLRAIDHGFAFLDRGAHIAGHGGGILNFATEFFHSEYPGPNLTQMAAVKNMIKNRAKVGAALKNLLNEREINFIFQKADWLVAAVEGKLQIDITEGVWESVDFNRLFTRMTRQLLAEGKYRILTE